LNRFTNPSAHDGRVVISIGAKQESSGSEHGGMEGCWSAGDDSGEATERKIQDMGRLSMT
jgi:hypothetical protein